MVTKAQLHRLATRPQDFVRYQLTGRLPEGVTPKSPLISLLQVLAPRDRMAILNVAVDSRVGYTGRRVFANAEQALKWLAPSSEVFGSFPAESWRDKRFHRKLTLTEVLACAGEYPENLPARYPTLK